MDYGYGQPMSISVHQDLGINELQDEMLALLFGQPATLVLIPADAGRDIEGYVADVYDAAPEGSTGLAAIYRPIPVVSEARSRQAKVLATEHPLYVMFVVLQAVVVLLFPISIFIFAFSKGHPFSSSR